ncbi:hypothetical protein L6R53_10555 [Myxococcota bacterium]|nr:hypothetical protein [Myxococcota bacterium]
MLTDIVDFSKLPTWAQQQAVDHLLAGLEALDLMVERRKAAASYLNSTGDGFLLAVSSKGPAELPRQLCLAARRLVEHCRPKSLAGMSLEIRVGIHVGRLFVDPARPDGGFAVGTGLNWTARIGGLAGASQVLVSEEFASLVLDHLGPVAFDAEFHPPHDQPPYEATVKHGKQARLRILRDGGGVELNHQSPPKMGTLQLVDDHLARSVRVVASTLEAVMAQVPDDTAGRNANPRYTIWVPRGDRMLRLPVAHGDARPQDPERSTSYAIGDGTVDGFPGAEGPVAHAFHTGQPVVMTGLPAWSGADGDREGYLSRWECLGVPRSKVESFSRHSRCVLAIPMTLRPRVAGVLCVDLREPFDAFEAELRAFCLRIMETSGSFIAALLLAREQ